MAYQSKKHRKFVASAVTAAVVASAVAPAAGFAAEAPKFKDVPTWAKDAVDYLVGKGAINGYEDGTFKPDQSIKRAEAAKILAVTLGLTIDDNAKTDLKDAKDHWASKYIAAIQKHNKDIISGYENGTFKPEATITRQEMAKMVVTAYNLKLDESAVLDFTDNNGWGKDYINILASLGVVNGKSAGKFAPNASVTRAETPVFVHRAEVPSVRLEVKTSEAKVVSVSAINGKQLEIKFSQAIDKSTVVEEANGTLVDGLLTINALKKADGNNSAAVTPDAASASLSEDGKTLTVSLQTSEVFNGKYAVAVNKGVKTKTSVEVPAFSVILDVADKVAPEFVSATAEGKTATKTVTVKFSEPVQNSSVIAYVDGKPATVSRPAGTSINELVITAGSDLEAGKAYELSLLNVKDYADNLMATNPYKTSFTVSANTSAPTVSEVKVTGENKVEVKFNKNVSQASFANNARLLDVNGQLISLLNATVKSDGKTVALTAASPITYGPNGTFTGNLLIGSDVTDVYGNKLGTAYSQSVTFTKDTVAPTVAKVEYSNSKLIVTFNEDITAKAANLTGSSLINDSTGVSTALSTAFGATAGTHARIINDNQLEIPVSLNAGNYTLRLAKGVVKDTAGVSNENAASINSFTVKATSTTDTAAPVFTMDSINRTLVNLTVSGQNVGAPNEEQTIAYVVQDASGIDLASVRDVNNYTLDGKALPIGTYVTTNYNGTDSDALTVTLHLLSSKIIETKPDYQLVISGIKDKAGNTAAPQIAEKIALHDGVAPELSSAVISAGDNNTLVLGFSETVTGVDKTDFVFTINGVDVTGAASLSVQLAGSDKGKAYVSFTTVADSGKLYLDVDGNGFDAGDVLLGTTADAAGLLNLKASYVSSIKVDVASGANVVDTQGNVIVSKTITVK